MAAPYKSGGRLQPHREEARAANIAAAKAANAALEPLPENPPDWLTDEAARNAWREIRPQVMDEVARRADSQFFGILCTLFVRAIGDGDLSATTLNTLTGMMDKMGMTPTGRRRLAQQYGLGQGDTTAEAAARFARFDDPAPAPFAATLPAEPPGIDAAAAPAKSKPKTGAKRKAATHTRKAPARDHAGRFARFDAPADARADNQTEGTA